MNEKFGEENAENVCVDALLQCQKALKEQKPPQLPPHRTYSLIVECLSPHEKELY